MASPVSTLFCCPYTLEPLILEARQGVEILVRSSGRSYELVRGIPRLLSDADELFSEEQQQENAFYEQTYSYYDEVIDWLFRSFKLDEPSVRARMVDLLNLAPDALVLETGAGTCRDSVHIADRLGPDGHIFLQDLSPNMLRLGQQRISQWLAHKHNHCAVDFFIGNACRLPFQTASLDAAFHFGGLNVFSDKRQAIAEMARVVKPGGRVVFGDEGLAPWRRDTLYGKILVNSSHLYSFQAPIDLLPEQARDACLRWIIGDAYYLIDFTVGEGAPDLDLDLPIIGRRGGTHRTRYFGLLEGVTPEVKQKAVEAAARAGESLHSWLDRVVKKAAESDAQ
jgi:ubiquinone/menaquinone biosynthesis C-methylase UbiE